MFSHMDLKHGLAWTSLEAAHFGFVGTYPSKTSRPECPSYRIVSRHWFGTRPKMLLYMILVWFHCVLSWLWIDPWVASQIKMYYVFSWALFNLFIWPALLFISVDTKLSEPQLVCTHDKTQMSGSHTDAVITHPKSKYHAACCVSSISLSCLSWMVLLWQRIEYIRDILSCNLDTPNRWPASCTAVWDRSLGICRKNTGH